MVNTKKNNLAAIVTVRALSTRLEKKCFQKIFQELSMIELVIARAKKIGFRVIVATSEDCSDDEVAIIAQKNNVDIYRGSLLNKIHRWHSCFEKYSLDYAMLIDADDPTFSFSLAKDALNKLISDNNDSVKGSDDLLPGLITLGFSANGMKKLFSTASDYNTDTDVIDVFLDRADLRYSKVHPRSEHEFLADIRLTVDYEEDLNFYQSLFNKVSYLEDSSIIVKAIKDNNLSIINWFRNEEFKNNQADFNKRVK